MKIYNLSLNVSILVFNFLYEPEVILHLTEVHNRSRMLSFKSEPLITLGQRGNLRSCLFSLCSYQTTRSAWSTQINQGNQKQWFLSPSQSIWSVSLGCSSRAQTFPRFPRWKARHSLRVLIHWPVRRARTPAAEFLRTIGVGPTEKREPTWRKPLGPRKPPIRKGNPLCTLPPGCQAIFSKTTSTLYF